MIKQMSDDEKKRTFHGRNVVASSKNSEPKCGGMHTNLIKRNIDFIPNQFQSLR